MRSPLVGFLFALIVFPASPKAETASTGVMYKGGIMCIGEGSGGGMGNTVTLAGKTIKTTTAYTNDGVNYFQSTTTNWDIPDRHPSWSGGIHHQVRRRGNTVSLRISNAGDDVDTGGWETISGTTSDASGSVTWPASSTSSFDVWTTTWVS